MFGFPLHFVMMVTECLAHAIKSENFHYILRNCNIIFWFQSLLPALGGHENRNEISSNCLLVSVATGMGLLVI